MSIDLDVWLYYGKRLDEFNWGFNYGYWLRLELSGGKPWFDYKEKPRCEPMCCLIAKWKYNGPKLNFLRKDCVEPY